MRTVVSRELPVLVKVAMHANYEPPCIVLCNVIFKSKLVDAPEEAYRMFEATKQCLKKTIRQAADCCRTALRFFGCCGDRHPGRNGCTIDQADL